MAEELIAKEIAEQIALQVGESISDLITKVLQSQTQSSGQTSIQDRMGDIGGTERLEKASMDNSGMLFSNQKRTYDEYQHESLESIKRNRSYVDKIISDNHLTDQTQRNIANQALQNAVETSNLVGKQCVRHADVAIDRQWNIDEQNWAVTEILRTNIFKEALESAVAAAVAATINEE